jgi:hypothetical protein
MRVSPGTIILKISPPLFISFSLSRSKKDARQCVPGTRSPAGTTWNTFQNFLCRNTRRHSSSQGMFLYRNKPPLLGNYFPVLIASFGISTVYQRLFHGGGHFIELNLSTKF